MDPVSKSRSEERKNNAKKLGGVTGKGFKPGQSGNPGGRPKKKPLSEIYEEIFNDPGVREKVKQQIIKTMTSKGMAGVLERREAGERVEGKVAQTVDLEVSGKLTLEQVLQARKKSGK